MTKDTHIQVSRACSYLKIRWMAELRINFLLITFMTSNDFFQLYENYRL